MIGMLKISNLAHQSKRKLSKFTKPRRQFSRELLYFNVELFLPFKIVPVIQEYPETNKIEVSVRLKAIFEESNFGTNVVCKIPVPANTAQVRIFSSGTGRAIYEPDSGSIMWRFKRFQGNAESLLTADVQLIPSTQRKVWNKPPISLDF